MLFIVLAMIIVKLTISDALYFFELYYIGYVWMVTSSMFL